MTAAAETLALALRIDAPMQSWGIQSRFVDRDTASEPTKSGIVGLLGAALGMERSDTERIAHLAGLRMAVRVDREGRVERDYHTASNVPNTEGKSHRTVVSERYYLADAVFLVLLEGEVGLITELERAVLAPRWPLFFGRRSFVPGVPLIEPDLGRRDRLGTGIRAGSLEREWCRHPWLDDGSAGARVAPRQDRRPGWGEPTMLRVVADTDVDDPRGELRNDHPLSFAHRDRRFRARAVRVEHVALDEVRRGGD